MQCGEARHWTAGDTTPAVAGEPERLPRSVVSSECSTAYCGTIGASRNDLRTPCPDYRWERRPAQVPQPATTGIFPIFACHSFGPVWCTDVPCESTATVTGMSTTSNS